jgi:hypothetical protein
MRFSLPLRWIQTVRRKKNSVCRFLALIFLSFFINSSFEIIYLLCRIVRGSKSKWAKNDKLLHFEVIAEIISQKTQRNFALVERPEFVCTHALSLSTA